MPDLAYRAGVNKDRRRCLGRWAFDNTADVYTREHRTVISDIWAEVLEKLPHLDDQQDLVPDSEDEDLAPLPPPKFSAGSEEKAEIPLPIRAKGTEREEEPDAKRSKQTLLGK